MTNGNKVIRDQLAGRIDVLEACCSEDSEPELLTLRVLSTMWDDVVRYGQGVKSVKDCADKHPSLLYLLRFKTMSTVARIYFIGLGLYVTYSLIGEAVGWDKLLASFLP